MRIYRADGKQPDGPTIMPWQRGRILIWDVTCPDTFAPSHQQLAVREAGTVAVQQERWKAGKYEELDATHHFVPVAVETTGVFGPDAHSFGSWSLASTSEKSQGRSCCATTYSKGLQWLSRGDICTAAVKGTSPVDSDLTDVF